MAVPETRPNHTIYINNLNEKIKKDGEFLGESRIQDILYESAPFPSLASTSSAFSRQNVNTSAFAHAASFGFNTPSGRLTLCPLTCSLLLILQGFSS